MCSAEPSIRTALEHVGGRVRELFVAPATGRHRLANAEIPDRSLGTATTHSGKRAVVHGLCHALLLLSETDRVSKVMSRSATGESIRR